MTITAGLDVGGAHLKVALAEDGRIVAVRQIACPLWQGFDQLEAALASGNDWFKAAAARGDAVAAGDAYATLGDEAKRQTAADLVAEIDTRLWRTIYLLSAIVIGLIGWLVAWSWLRYPARLLWPSPRGMAVGRPEARCPVPAEVPDRVVASHGATVVVTGHDPAERRAWLVHRSR